MDTQTRPTGGQHITFPIGEIDRASRGWGDVRADLDTGSGIDLLPMLGWNCLLYNAAVL